MITEFKTYKNIPKVGDWVILISEPWISDVKPYIISDMFEIIKVSFTEKNETYYYTISLQGSKNADIPDNIPSTERIIIEEIEYFGTKEDCEIYLQTSKYNL